MDWLSVKLATRYMISQYLVPQHQVETSKVTRIIKRETCKGNIPVTELVLLRAERKWPHPTGDIFWFHQDEDG
ncbi:hypothetical protein CapIbe_011212 [Capra ibex]